jgi:hypothetical protein
VPVLIVPDLLGGPPRFRSPPRRRLPTAQADRVSVGVGEHAHPRLGRDLTRGAALDCTSGEQGLAGRVQIVDVGEGHRSIGVVARIQADLESVEVVPDVLGLVGVRRAQQGGVDGLGGVQVGHRDHQAADRGTHVQLLRGTAVTSGTASFVDGMTNQPSRM